jgi:hypothetical protein
MSRPVLAVFILFLLIIGVSCSQKGMTVAAFDEIVSTPGDNTPLAGEMKSFPYWTNLEADITLKYEDGRNFAEHAVVTAKTVNGRYVVFTMRSQMYAQLMSSIVGYDPKTATYKIWGKYGKSDGSGNRITESSATFDLQKKTYAITAAYDDFTETGKGSYTDTEDLAQTLIYKNGVLVLTREVRSRPSGQ